ncbi:hypothetical protein AAVH_19949 [Aphelenchoides avenae]|nr:hypothetical protein AAVH_19949 [Aphelenchus avenae]
MPSWVLYWAVKPFGAEYDDQLHLYTVDCAKVDVFPGIRLVIGLGFSIDYTVPVKDFVVNVSTEAGPKCALLLAEGDLVIGTQFLPKRCVHLDYANKTISFADPVA